VALHLAILLLLLSTSLLGAQEQLAYKFSPGKTLNYAVNLDGTVTYGYQGVKPETMKARIKGILALTAESVSSESTVLMVTPRRTLITLNGMTLEDLTACETDVSSVLSTARMALSPEGRVISSEDVVEGMLSIGEMLKMLPSFPREKILPGARWTQTMPSLRFPGIPLCDLQFNYFYESVQGETAVIALQSNQSIREKKQDKDVSVAINGKNVSSGKFLFNKQAGEIVNFSGVFDVNLFVIFAMPASPELKGKRPDTVPLTAVIKLKLSLARQ